MHPPARGTPLVSAAGMLDHARMWFLVMSTGRRIPISALPTAIGSDASSGVHLPHPSVKPRHARLLPGAATGLRLEVCDGALVEVDGWAVTEADLRPGDELLVGEVRVRLGRDGSGDTTEIEAATPRQRPHDKTPTTPLSSPRPGPLSGPRSSARLAAGSAPTHIPKRRRQPPTPTGPTGNLPVRRGLLHADPSQLSIGTRCILGLALLLLATAIVWAVQALILALS